jgi:hypothetical protein
VVAAFVPFAFFVLLAAARMPMSYDDAYNATVPLNLVRGHGYATSFAGLEPFNPSISSGAAFLAPAALPIALFGAQMHWPMLYAALLCLTLSSFLLRSMHTHSPQAALAAALLAPFMLWQGKNDVVALGDVLPPPPFGYWYQLLGNLPGILALALAMSLLVERAPRRAARSIAIVALVLFGVNAKVMHIIPLAAMAAMWAALPLDRRDSTPATRARLRRLGLALVLIAAGWLGLRLNRMLAWLVLDGATFRNVLASENALLEGRVPALPSLRPAELFAFAKIFSWNCLRAVPFLGGALQAPMTFVLLVTTALTARRFAAESSLARLALVLLAGAAAHFGWWVMSSAAFRHLTPVAGLAWLALGCGLGLSWLDLRRHAAGTFARHGLLWGCLLALLCVAGAPNLVAALGGWKELRDHKNEQLSATAALERLVEGYPDAAFCSSGWYVPRELTYLAPAHIATCDLHVVQPSAAGRRILLRATNLWPAGKEKVERTLERCPSRIERVGRFEFRACDGLQPGGSAAP